ncbi:MAG TPA: sigma-70 family RNA polymerase sigma factor [Chitinophaga sp.]
MNVLQLVAQGNREAFRHLFNDWWDTVYSAALRLTKSPEMAEDLAQEVFIRVWDHREKLPALDNMGGFLYTITRNLARDLFRKQLLHDSNLAFLSTYFDVAGNTPSQVLEQKELAGKIGRALDRLPEHLRKVFLPRYMEGQSHQAISVALQITPVTSRVFLARAVQQLRTDLSGEGPLSGLFPLIFLPFFLLDFFSNRG